MLMCDFLRDNCLSESWSLTNNISSLPCFRDADLRRLMWYYAYGDTIIDCYYATNVICYTPSQNDTNSYRLSMSNWYTSPRYTNSANFLLGGADASKYTSYSYYCYYVHNDMDPYHPSCTAGKLPFIHCGYFSYNDGAGPMGLGILLWCQIEYYDSSDSCQHLHNRLIFYHDGTGSIDSWYNTISFDAKCYIDCFDYSLFECNGGNITRITAYVKVLEVYDLCSFDLTSVTSYIPNFKTYYELNKTDIYASYSYNPRTGEYTYQDVTFNNDNGGYTSDYAISEEYSGRNGGSLHWDGLSVGNSGWLSIYVPFAIKHASSSLSYV